MTEKKGTVSIVIPVYFAELTLDELVKRLVSTLQPIALDFEILLVNDGSGDRSWEVIQQLAENHKFVRGINLMRNYGQHNATLCGIMQAKFDTIVTMDDDLQHPPEEIPNLIAKLQDGFDVVYGIPRQKPHNFWRNWSSSVIKGLLSFVMGVKSLRGIGSFRCFRSKLRQAFLGFNKPEVVVDVLLSWGAHNYGYVTVEENPRMIGSSNYDFRKLVRLALVVLTGFSTAPLRITSLIGFCFILFGMGLFIYVLVGYFARGSVLGFPFLASIITLFSGAQLFVMGIFGEYLARVFERTSERPCYTIGDVTDGENL
jgi:glycosyltransferase involved in cell wall biosynthesis